MNSITFKLHRLLYTHENDFRIQFNTLVLTYHIALLKVYMWKKMLYLFMYLSNAAAEFCQKFIFLHIGLSQGFVLNMHSLHWSCTCTEFWSQQWCREPRLLSYMNLSVRASKISTTLRVFHTPPNIFCKTMFL